jgi:hypothetical protein
MSRTAEAVKDVPQSVAIERIDSSEGSDSTNSAMSRRGIRISAAKRLASSSGRGDFLLAW